MNTNIWHKAYTMSAMGLHNNLYTVNIYTRSSVSTVVTLQGARNMFEYQEDENEDVMLPMRSSTGYIRYIYQGIDYDVRPTTMLDRFVEVLKNDSPFWYGFLMPESFNQPYDSDPYEIEIPCQSILGALSSIQMQIPTSGTGQMTFAQMVTEAFDQLMGEETNILTYLYLPRATGTFINTYIQNILRVADIMQVPLYKFGFCETDESSPNANINGLVGWPWRKVFEEYLRLFGCCMHIHRDALYITIPTREDDYSRYTWSALHNASSSVNVYADKVGFLSNVTPKSTNNSTTIVRGVRSVKATINHEDLPYGVSIEYDKFYNPSAHNTTPDSYNDLYVYLSTASTLQGNIELVSGIAEPVLFDAWKISENDKHLYNSYQKAIRVKGNTNTPPTIITTNNAVLAFKLVGKTPLNHVYQYAGLIINGSALKMYKADTSGTRYILASLHVGQWWWAGNRWMSQTEVDSLGYAPTFSLPLDENGNISNSGVSADTSRTHSGKTGYLMPFTNQIAQDSIDTPPILCIYQPYNYGNNEYQFITGLELEFTEEVTPLLSAPQLDTLFYGWKHLPGSNEYEKLVNIDNEETYSVQYNASDWRTVVGIYAPAVDIIIGYQYVQAMKGESMTIISIGDAYAPSVAPYTILKSGDHVYRIMSIAFSTYNETGKVQVFETSIGEE